MIDAESIAKIREVRQSKNQLKLSPFNASEYADDLDELKPIQVRQYQWNGIRNMLMSPRMILGDSTGLGKTLQMLFTIGYIWVKEPEYVPIVLAKKSALHQWAVEVKKFMRGMETITIDNNPYERCSEYERFFSSHGKEKRLLIMTYDTLLKDARESVVRRTDHKASSADKKMLAQARKTYKGASESVKSKLKEFSSWFDGRPYEVWDYAKTVTAVGAPETRSNPPNVWTDQDESQVLALLSLMKAEQSWKSEAQRLEAIVHPTVVVPGIFSHIEAFSRKHPDAKFMLILDEAHVVKNHTGKIHAIVAELARYCERVYGLTATPVKNRLMEFFSIFRVVIPELFPKVTWFHREYCVTKLQRIGPSRSVPIVVGYRNLDAFVRTIEPFYLSRQKYDVAAELPKLVTKELQCELTDLQEELYDLAEAGMLERDTDTDASAASVLSAMTFVQEAADAPGLLKDENGNPWVGSSPKIDAILEMLEDELSGAKVIIFSRFERMVSITEKALNDKEIKCVRITGKEDKASDRERAKKLFQDPNSGVNTILITEAGSESINLQAAEYFILIDSPWSFGTYVQLIGRMIRIGSTHSTVVAIHLCSVKKDGKKTIDHYVIKKLKGKKALADKVAGEGLKGGLEFVKKDDDIRDLVEMIKRGQEDTGKPQDGAGRPEVAKKDSKPRKTPSCAQEVLAVDTPDIEI